MALRPGRSTGEGLALPAPDDRTGAGAATAGAAVPVQPAVLRQAAGESRRLRGELQSSVTRAEPDTTAAVQALAGGWATGPALSQALSWWKARWTSLDNRLGLTGDRLDATARSYHATDDNAATTFKGP